VVDYGQLSCGIVLLFLSFLLLFGFWKLHKWRQKQPPLEKEEEQGIPPIFAWLILGDLFDQRAGRHGSDMDDKRR
jgi:hypothetical protein